MINEKIRCWDNPIKNVSCLYSTWQSQKYEMPVFLHGNCGFHAKYLVFHGMLGFFHKKNWVWCVESDISGNVC
jgi:hypothetical protein